MASVIFVLLFFFIVNRNWIRSFFEGFVNQESKPEDLKDQKILELVKSKTGLKLNKIKLLDTKTTWAMMAGLPAMPYMIISKDAYENFSKDEMEWLLLHEAGHYALWHNAKMILHQLLFIAIGVWTLSVFNELLVALLVAVSCAILHTQLVRRFEYEANYYALSKMDNSKGLKNMYEKAKQRWRKSGKGEDTFWHKLFNIWILDIYKDLVLKSAK